MNRVHVLLLAALCASALVLVHYAYEARRLFSALERSKNEHAALQADFKRLDAERQAQATHLRVERLARERLQMRAATPAVTEYVKDVAVAAKGASK